MAEFPFTARATLKYKSPPGSGSTIAFAKGDSLTVLSSDDDGDWYTGQLQDGTEGVFPSAFVERVEEQEAQPAAPAAVAQEPAQPQEEEKVPASSPSAKVEEPVQAEAEQAQAAPAPVLIAAPSPPAPTRQTSLPPAQDTAASSPPEAPKKPGSLRDRIAALNAQGAGAGGPGAPPPLPRAKPPAFKRAPIPTPAVANSSSSPEQPSAPILSSSPPERIERGAVANPAFSAEDAKASIGKGGSLKDRIAALQGMSLDTPAPPGRAPKPWKKKSVEVPEATAEPTTDGEGVSTSAETEEGSLKVAAGEEDVDGQVKDEVPAETETTAQSPGAEVPQFSPASPPSNSPAPEPHPFVAPPIKQDDDDESTAVNESAVDANSPDVADEDGEPVDEEVEKRKAIAARMAGLGGQRVGMAMPALPKRAGPPRRRAPVAASPTAEEATSPIAVGSEESAKEESSPVEASQKDAVVEPAPPVQEAVAAPIAEPETLDESTPINEPSPVEEKDATPAQDEEDSIEREVAEPVTLSSNPLLASQEDSEEEEGDDFDAPALPTGDSDDDFATPALPQSSSPIAQHSNVDQSFEQPRAEPQGEPEFISDAPPPPPTRRSLPPPPPPAQPPRDDSDEEQVDDYSDEEPASKPDLSVETADLDEGLINEVSPPPTSPATASRPAIPGIPATFASPVAAPVKEAIVIPRSTEPESEEEDDNPVPTSPATASRPAIPGIPASFAAPTAAPARPMPIVPLRQPEEEDQQEGEDEQFAAAHTPQSEAVDSPMDPSLPPPSAPPAAPKSVPPPPPTVDDSEDSAAPRQAAGGEMDGEEESDGDEEDPEVARRAALAARMAKLGGMNMRMGPMFPPVGGMRPPTKKKSVAEPVDEPAPSEDAEEPAPLPRRLPGIPTGGFALPGIVAPVRAAEPEPEQEEEPVEQQEDHVAQPEAEQPTDEEQVGEPESEVAPPPLPTGRPSSMLPPRRSVPTPQATEDGQDDSSAPPSLPSGRPLPPQPQVAEQFVEEPEMQEEYEDVEEQAPLPPTRPQGGLPPVPTAVNSPPLPPTASPPASPPSRRTSLFKSSSKHGSTSELDRQPTRTSLDSTRGLGLASSGYSGDEFSPQRSNSTSAHPLSALPEGSSGFLPRDIDLEQGSQWWRATPFGPPSSIRSRRDILYDVSESSATKRGKTRFDNEIEVIYPDLSKTVIAISFDAGDNSEATTSLSQAHHAPPSFSNAQLSQLSSTIGAQIFAAAHSKLSDKGAREQSGETLVNFCLGRATEPLGPRGWSYGAIVLQVENGGKGKASVLNEVDEPRAGDVIVFHDTKFKHNLSTTRVGSAERPFVAIVAAWDGKKRKVKTIEVGSSGAVEEGGHRTEDLKSGRVSVWRVLSRDAV